MRAARTSTSRRSVPAAVILTALAILPSSAGAATVSVSGLDLLVVAEPGEVNEIVISEAPGRIALADVFAPLTAGPGCSPGATAGEATCDNVPSITVVLGDGDDSFVDLDLNKLLRVKGGEGNDEIAGQGAGTYIFRGLGGEDDLRTLQGDAELDSLDGGDGDDSITSGDGRSSLIGGPGADSIDGGDGFNLIDGKAGDDAIDAGGQRDRIAGGAGDDAIAAGDGPDEVVPGSGADRINVRDAFADLVDCVRREDRVRSDGRDRVLECGGRAGPTGPVSARPPPSG